MIEIRKSSDRGHYKIDWLDSYHSFSFGNYYDPYNTNFGPLRVFNDDTIQPIKGFPTHPHKNMEIVTIILEGTIAHKDSSGGEGIITVNEVQRMTAGSGIFHSEFNPSHTVVLKLFQIWFIPNKTDLSPSYEQRKFFPEEKHNRFLKIVSGKKENSVISINQDAEIFLSDLNKGKTLTHEIQNQRGVYFHLINGDVSLNGYLLKSGDAVKVIDESRINITAEKNSHIILIDLTMNF